ncbi:JAB domain-containing protein [Clostridium magnum]|uniref:MPN domain-containing protein n=1 Tax=Clostridium magnum DSM 2767 TaxID=1121326 RepID=A0A161X4M0_9CLOT|nr:JAB domain-containing protein [Clostridium magnum]KZL88866.1 hypothetical protein CLMAG_57700 [Clostridium magnum DSM 2767]SHI50669.1 DNA repair protein RadC [Clostridium magnum DSM 2767]
MSYLENVEQVSIELTEGNSNEGKKKQTVITTYSLKIVKESSGKYDVSKKVSKPADAADIFRQVLDMEYLAEEVLAMATLDIKNKVIGIFEVSRGSLNSSIVHPREIFKRACLQNAASILLAHNHPSGDPAPSKEDINITGRLKECGKLLGIELLDHIILGENSRFVSLKEKGLL